MPTKLISLNYQEKTLRGILNEPPASQKAVLFLGGFERKATTEKKFKALADLLAQKNIASLRFDYEGLGLSDGNYAAVTIQKLSREAKIFFSFLKQNFSGPLFVVAHSLGACVLAATQEEIEKIILIAPALDQKNLLRYWFLRAEKPTEEITWGKYHSLFSQDKSLEEKFQKYCQTEPKETKENLLRANYFLENKNKDYFTYYQKINPSCLLHIHGEKDDKVPLASLNKISFSQQILVSAGDHDLEKPSLITQWLKPAVNFFSS